MNVNTNLPMLISNNKPLAQPIRKEVAHVAALGNANTHKPSAQPALEMRITPAEKEVMMASYQEKNTYQFTRFSDISANAQKAVQVYETCSSFWERENMNQLFRVDLYA